MSKEETELLGYHGGVVCPYCQKEIYILEYRQQPATLEDIRKHAREVLKAKEKARRNE